MYQFENICVNNALFLHFAKLCVLIFWDACFCSRIAFWVARDFRPDFGPGSNLKLFVCVKIPSFCVLQNFVFLSFGRPLFVV